MGKGFVPDVGTKQTESKQPQERGPMTTAPCPALAPETKSADVAAAFEEFARAFDAFKDTNETRLHEIETRLSSDVLTEEKLARIDEVLEAANRRHERATLDARRPALGAAATEPRD